MTYAARPLRGVHLLLCAVLLAAALAACATSTAPDGSKAAPVPADDIIRAGSAPSVTGATNLSSKPKIAAGSGAPPTTLVTKDLVTGKPDAAAASATSTVSVRYVGVLWADGQEFDSSWDRGNEPVIFPLNGVIPGFQQGIDGMRVGSRREIVIPPDLGYGSVAQGPIPGDSTLVFVVDLVDVRT